MWILSDLSENSNYSYSFVKNVFSEEELSKINCLNVNFSDGMVLNNSSNEIRKSKISWLSPDEESYHWIYQRISEIVNEINFNYYKFNLTYIEDLQLTTYQSEFNDHYNWHVDVQEMLSPINDIRKLSFTILISDQSEFKGGEFVVKNDERDLVVEELEAGTIIIFPSFLVHKVNPVILGTRKSLVGWVRGPNFV